MNKQELHPVFNFMPAESDPDAHSRQASKAPEAVPEPVAEVHVANEDRLHEQRVEIVKKEELAGSPERQTCMGIIYLRRYHSFYIAISYKNIRYNIISCYAI